MCGISSRSKCYIMERWNAFEFTVLHCVVMMNCWPCLHRRDMLMPVCPLRQLFEICRSRWKTDSNYWTATNSLSFSLSPLKRLVQTKNTYTVCVLLLNTVWHLHWLPFDDCMSIEHVWKCYLRLPWCIFSGHFASSSRSRKRKRKKTSRTIDIHKVPRF